MVWAMVSPDAQDGEAELQQLHVGGNSGDSGNWGAVSRRCSGCSCLQQPRAICISGILYPEVDVMCVCAGVEGGMWEGGHPYAQGGMCAGCESVSDVAAAHQCDGHAGQELGAHSISGDRAEG
jgi:hypothetical protein